MSEARPMLASWTVRGLCLVTALCLAAGAAAAPRQDLPPAQPPAPGEPPPPPEIDSVEQGLVDRPIAVIVLEGLKRVEEQLVRNQLRSAVGDAYDPATVRADVRLLYRLGQFRDIVTEAKLLPDGTVELTYRFEEQQIIQEVQTVGNKVLSDQDLRTVIAIAPPVARDDFRIQNAVRAIKTKYESRGHYLVDVEVDEAQLTETGVLIFRIIEGPRVKVRAIEFEGNASFTRDQLMTQVQTRKAMLFIRRGELDQERLIDDVARLDKYYKDRGFLDVRVDRRIELSPDTREAKVVYLIAEGRQFLLRSVRATRADGGPLSVFAQEQIIALLELKPGDVFSVDKLNKSLRVVQESYELMGHLDVNVRSVEYRTIDGVEIDLELLIEEGTPYKVGLVLITGNTITRDKVVRREVHLQPGRPFDGREISRSEERLNRTRLFAETRITVQDPDPKFPDYRDVLVEVKESNTGSFNFGVAFGSDTGAFGTISLSQRNFDIQDTPESLEEWIRGRAFRGAGQKFSLVLLPGNEVSEYSISLTEPRAFESDFSLGGTAMYRARQYNQYDEDRAAVSTTVGRRFGEIWNMGVTAAVNRVKLTDIDRDAPVDFFENAGPYTLTSLGISLTRTTIATIRRPGDGSRLELSLSQAGAFGGDYTFTTATMDYTVYYTLAEDFLGRKSTLRLNSRLGRIFGDAPPSEKFYLGGRTFRGFEFRTISPKGIRADNGELGDDPVGGDWMFFLGAQYEFPLFQDAVTAVLFCDSGTVTDGIGFDDYRVSVGTGIRLYIPQFGEVPIAVDFGFPLLEAEGDESQLVSFSVELPFN
jgi:outer membrane protein insertion porin family